MKNDSCVHFAHENAKLIVNKPASKFRQEVPHVNKVGTRAERFRETQRSSMDLEEW